jgi:hypothetical protein
MPAGVTSTADVGRLITEGRALLMRPARSEGPQKGWRRRTNPVHTMTEIRAPPCDRHVRIRAGAVSLYH